MAAKRVNFKDSVAQYNAIAKSVRARDFAPIYLLMGDESYFIDSICDMLASTILNEAERSFNQITLYGRDCDAAAVTNNARQHPMMGGCMVIIVKEAQQMRNFDKLSVYTSNPMQSTILILCHKEKSVDKRSQLYKSITKNGTILESIRPRDYEIGSWLSGYCSGRGLQLSAKAQSMLLENLGSDISKIEGELSKLIIALPEGTQIVNDDHIEQYVGISKDYNNFELCNAVVTRNHKRALLIADHFAHNTKSYPLLLSVWMLFTQFKQLFIIGYLRWMSKNRGTTFPTDMELMRQLKLSNPFAVSELKQRSGMWSNKQLFYIMGLLRDYDTKSKGMNTGGANEGELLRELILKIFAA